MQNNNGQRQVLHQLKKNPNDKNNPQREIGHPKGNLQKNVIVKAAADENVSSQGANRLKLLIRSIWKLQIVSTLVLKVLRSKDTRIGNQKGPI